MIPSASSLLLRRLRARSIGSPLRTMTSGIVDFPWASGLVKFCKRVARLGGEGAVVNGGFRIFRGRCAAAGKIGVFQVNGSFLRDRGLRRRSVANRNILQRLRRLYK